ncbi:MAG: AAA family ATPase [Geminicoccales bacterium]
MSSIDADALPSKREGGIAWMWRAIRKHLNKIMSIVLIASAAMTAYLLSRDNVYTAQTEILLDPQTNSSGNLEEVDAQSLSDVMSAEIESELRLISSSQIILQVIDELDLSADQSRWDLNALASTWLGIAPARSEGLSDEAINRTRALESVRQNLAIDRDATAPVINVRFTSTDPEQAALVANGLAEAYLKDRIETKRGALNETADSLQRSVNEIKALTESVEGDDETPKRLYEIMLDRYQAAQEEKDNLGDSARVIERATVPSAPSNFSGLLLLGFAVASSSVAGIAAAFLLEARRQGYANANEIERDLGYQVVSLIPLVREAKGKKKSAERWQVYEAYGMNEAIKTLVYALLPKKDLHDQQTGKIVAITSSYPDEGKSTVALSLARQASFSGLRTLLIEGDLRKSGLNAGLQTIQPAYGLADLLRSTVDDVYECVCTEPESGVDIMLGFGPADDAFKLLYSERMAQLLEAIRPLYDLVILDCAPIMAVSETRALVDLADESVFVIRWKTTERTAAKTAIRDLERLNAKITGIVVNQVDLREHLRYEDADRLAYQEKYARYITG